MSGSHVFLLYVRRSFVLRWALLFAAFGIPLAVLAVSEGVRTHRRVQDFYPTRAEIQTKYRIGGRGGPSHFLLIRYLDRAGGQHECRVRASRVEYVESRRGDEIAAYVSGIDPSDAWLVTAGQPGYKRTMALAGFAGGTVVPLLAMLEWLRRRAAVLREGHPLAGRVEKAGRDYRIRFSTKFHYRVTWSCTAPDGRLWRGKSLHVPKTLVSKWRPGDEIEVYFDPRHPLIAEVDVYGLRNGDRK